MRDGSLRYDAIDSDAGNLPKAKVGFASAALKALLATVNLNTTKFNCFQPSLFPYKYYCASFVVGAGCAIDIYVYYQLTIFTYTTSLIIATINVIIT
jgi:hypothetical protein